MDGRAGVGRRWTSRRQDSESEGSKLRVKPYKKLPRVHLSSVSSGSKAKTAALNGFINMLLSGAFWTSHL